MIELVIYNYLKSILSVPVYMEKPKEPDGKYVVVEKTGSSEENYIMSATFAIQCYAQSLYDAAELNETVKKEMQNIINTEDVMKSKLNSDYNFTDTRTKEYRYQSVFDLVY